MNIEKIIAYLFLTFILIIACFNIVGSVSMLIIDKRDDVQTLRHLGASDHLIFRIFLFEGRFIALLGALLGTLLGVGLCVLQQQFGLIELGGSAGSFIVDAYPVSIHFADVAPGVCHRSRGGYVQRVVSGEIPQPPFPVTNHEFWIQKSPKSGFKTVTSGIFVCVSVVLTISVFGRTTLLLRVNRDRHAYEPSGRE